LSVLEGSRHPTTLVVLEFPDRAAVEEWYAAAEPGEAPRFRDEGRNPILVLVDAMRT
jgi:uncharacterized protein (DUF1330 family)